MYLFYLILYYLQLSTFTGLLSNIFLGWGVIKYEYVHCVPCIWNDVTYHWCSIKRKGKKKEITVERGKSVQYGSIKALKLNTDLCSSTLFYFPPRLIASWPLRLISWPFGWGPKVFKTSSTSISYHSEWPLTQSRVSVNHISHRGRSNVLWVTLTSDTLVYFSSAL